MDGTGDSRAKDRLRKKVGRLGEGEACRHLVGLGQTVIDRNWRSGHLEIDIVTVDDRGLHFVEVKTRRPPMQADPQDSVDFAKQKRLTLAAAAYLRRRPDLAGMECFFDILTVVFDPDGTRIEYFPQAFVPVFFGR